MNIAELLRTWDFNTFTLLHKMGIDSVYVSWVYYVLAKYGIVFFLFSFTYLIWRRKINAFLCSFMAMGLAGLIDLIIFALWQRPRPFISYDNLVVPSLDRLDVGRMSSFPSSHTYIVFAIATSILLYGHRRLGAALFILAVLVAISRAGSGLHYPSDTIAGALLGIVSGILAYRFVHKNQHKWEYTK